MSGHATVKNVNNTDAVHYTVGGSDQRASPTQTLVPSMPAKCVGLAAHVQMSALAAPFDCRCRNGRCPRSLA